MARAAAQKRKPQPPISVSSRDKIDEEIFKVLSGPSLNSNASVRRIEALGKRYGGLFYVRLLWTLAHVHLDERMAPIHWANIVERRDDLARKMESDIDVRVALVDYFLQTNKRLKH